MSFSHIGDIHVQYLLVFIFSLLVTFVMLSKNSNLFIHILMVCKVDNLSATYKVLVLHLLEIYIALSYLYVINHILA